MINAYLANPQLKYVQKSSNSFKQTRGSGNRAIGIRFFGIMKISKSQVI